MQRKRHDEELLARCVARVLAGERATVVSKEMEIPYTTLLGRVDWKRKGYDPNSRKRHLSELSVDKDPVKRAAPLPVPEVDEMEILRMIAKMQQAEINVRRRDVLKKANEMKDPEAAECAIQWFQRFRERNPQVSGTGSHLVLEASLMQQLLTSEEKNTESREEKQEEEGETQLTPTQRALQVLQSGYATQLKTEDLVEAFDLMADPLMARVFLVISPGPVRDLWLKQRIQKFRDAQVSE